MCQDSVRRSAVAADHRSCTPNIPGVPWWGAVLLAATVTADRLRVRRGLGRQGPQRRLRRVCTSSAASSAVLAVRQAGIFTAVIQPPLILFVAVPTAYFVFHGGKITGIKDMLINCGYPLIERFPLMFFTSAVVLLIGMGRWYLGHVGAAGRARRRPSAEATPSSGLPRPTVTSRR